jgi:hypothetical protein
VIAFVFAYVHHRAGLPGAGPLCNNLAPVVKTIRTIYSDSRKRRVIIFQRDDGSFGFDEEHFSDEPLELSWLQAGYDSRCDTAERAFGEAQGRVPWLAEKKDGLTA